MSVEELDIQAHEVCQVFYGEPMPETGWVLVADRELFLNGQPYGLVDQAHIDYASGIATLVISGHRQAA